MKRILNFGFYLFLACLIFFSCKKDKPGEPIQFDPNSPFKTSLLVLNEGNFGAGNASFSGIHRDSIWAFNNLYQVKNQEVLGDVLQSVTRIGSDYYFAINNSNKIIITDSNFLKKDEVLNVTQPRFILPISNTMAYVSSIYSGKIFKLDLINDEIVGSIDQDGKWTEEMALYNDATGSYVLACTKDTAVNHLVKINTSTHQIVNRIPLAGYAPSAIVKASNGHFWVLAGSYLGRQSTLTEIDASNHSIVKSFTFPINWQAEKLAINHQDELFVLVNDYDNPKSGILKFESSTTNTPSTLFLSAPAGTFFYGVNIDIKNDDLYICDAKDFSQKGQVMRYNRNGIFLSSWSVGIIPNSVYFID